MLIRSNLACYVLPNNFSNVEGVVLKLTSLTRSCILFQGVRPSEARALKWKDVHLEQEILIICRTFSGSKIVERTKGRNVKPRAIGYTNFLGITLHRRFSKNS